MSSSGILTRREAIKAGFFDELADSVSGLTEFGFVETVDGSVRAKNYKDYLRGVELAQVLKVTTNERFVI